MPLIPPFNAQSRSQAFAPQPIVRDGVLLENCANIPPKPIQWVMPGWIPKGKLLTLAGPPGTGKTMLAINFAATISTGGKLPDGTYAQKGFVVIWTGEDDVDDTIVPRLIAAGADRSYIRIVRTIREGGRSRSFNPAKDIAALSREIMDAGDVALVVIDSIAQAIAGDSNKSSAVRQSLDPLVRLAEKSGCSVLGITHVNKTSKGKDPLDRVHGSLALGAVSRVVLLAAKETSTGREEDVQTCVLVRAKSNIESDHDGWRYHIEKCQFQSDGTTFVAARIVWHPERVIGSAKEILRQAEQPAELGKPSAVDEAGTFLKLLLSDGPKGVPEIEFSAQQAGIAMSAIKRAKTKLKIESHRQHSGPSSPSLWSLPQQMLGTRGYGDLLMPSGTENCSNFQAGYGFQNGLETTPFTNAYARSYGHSPQVFQVNAPAAPAAPVAPVAPAAPAASAASGSQDPLHQLMLDELIARTDRLMEKSRAKADPPVDEAMLTWLIAKCHEVLSKRYPNPAEYDNVPIDIPKRVAEEVLDSIYDEDCAERDKYLLALDRAGWYPYYN
jgi:DNA polymerase III delta prime subunit